MAMKRLIVRFLNWLFDVPGLAEQGEFGGEGGGQ